jgi:hypothetical protein
MWTRLRESLHRIWLVLNKSSGDRRTEKARTRFWAEVREGQQEADGESRP